MRRDQVFRVCCNHMITPDMRLVKKADAQNAWSWYTPLDATEEVPRPEKFTIKFKTQEIADKFKEAFDACQKLMSVQHDNKTSATTPGGRENKFGVFFEPIFSSEFMRDVVDPSNNLQQQHQQQETGTNGGIPLSHFPMQQSANQPIKPLMEVSCADPKPNPFAGFSFVKPALATTPVTVTSTSSSSPFSGFSFSKTAQPSPQIAPTAPPTHPPTPTPTLGSNVNPGVPNPANFPMMSSLCLLYTSPSPRDS